MKDLMMRAINLAQVRGAQYADVRTVHNTTESLAVKSSSSTAAGWDSANTSVDSTRRRSMMTDPLAPSLALQFSGT